MAAQLSFTNVRWRRPLRSWMARASSSFPVPVSPSRRTVESVGATIFHLLERLTKRGTLADDVLERALGPDLAFVVFRRTCRGR
jgi:hypothetical protein